MRPKIRPTVLLAFVLSACAGEIDDPTPFLQAAGSSTSATCDTKQVQEKILVPKCGACHSASLASGSLDLTSEGAAARLIGQASHCAGVTKPLVDSASPGTGFLFDKLSPSPGCGTPMPSGGVPLTAAEVTCLKSWLQNGGI
jgi:hypothetical protein